MEILPANESVEEGAANGEDIIPSLLNDSPFKIRPDDEKLAIVQKGRPVPKLFIVKRDSTRNCNRTFQGSWYGIHKWLCGSKQYNKLFCWPCTLMRPESSSWCSTGNDDMKRLSSMASKHSICKSHLKAIAEYNATLIGFGLLPEYVDEAKNENKEGEEALNESDSEDYFDLYFTDDQKSKKGETPAGSNPELKTKSQEISQTIQEKPASSRSHISFKAWLEMNKQSQPFSRPLSVEDRKLYKWRKKIARQELINARLTGQKIKIEIDLLKAKINHIKSIDASQNIVQAESSIRMPLIVPVETMDASNTENS